MSDHRELQELMDEFTRVGVDPDTFTAMLAVRPEDAMQVLRELPDDAGPAAFLSRLRQLSPRGATSPAPFHGTRRPHDEPPAARG